MRLDVATLRALIADFRAQGIDPQIILLNPTEKRDIKQELVQLGHQVNRNATSVAEDIENGRLLDRNGDAYSDEDLIGIVQGVVIASHPEVSRGKAKIIPKRI